MSTGQALGANVLVEVENWQLHGLAEKINAATKTAEASARTAVQAALDAGAALTSAKKLVVHGEWKNWLTANCDVAPRTAQAYMRLAKNFQQLDDQKRNAVADLPLREAIRAISTDPVAPPTVRYSDVQIAKRDDADRAVAALRNGAKALRVAAQNIADFRTIRGPKVAALRKKLTDAIDALDKLGGSNE